MQAAFAGWREGARLGPQLLAEPINSSGCVLQQMYSVGDSQSCQALLLFGLQPRSTPEVETPSVAGLPQGVRQLYVTGLL